MGFGTGFVEGFSRGQSILDRAREREKQQKEQDALFRDADRNAKTLSCPEKPDHPGGRFIEGKVSA